MISEINKHPFIPLEFWVNIDANQRKCCHNYFETGGDLKRHVIYDIHVTFNYILNNTCLTLNDIKNIISDIQNHIKHLLYSDVSIKYIIENINDDCNAIIKTYRNKSKINKRIKRIIAKLNDMY